MHTYTLAVVAFTVVSSVVLAYVLHKNNLFNIRIFVAIMISSIVVCILFPVLYNAISGIDALANGSGIVLAFILTFMVYILLVLIMSVVVSLLFGAVPSDKKAGGKNGAAREEKEGKTGREKSGYRTKKASRKAVAAAESEAADTSESPRPTASDTQMGDGVENIVDSRRNIDKMGLDAFGDNCADTIEGPEPVDAARQESPPVYAQEKDAFSEAAASEAALPVEQEEAPGARDITGRISEARQAGMSLGECVEEAFRLKECGDLEGAILYYMYALDNSPQKELVFLIILDICTLYKTLGQVELAREILESYADGYGGQMDDFVRAEIERNLQDM